MSLLFSPIALGNVELPNRIAVAPMCQYSATDGCASDWHLQHWMNLAMSGAGLVTVEATAVERHGRISHGDMGLYSDDNERAFARALAAARAVALPGVKFAVQLAHAGRKASSQRPWEGGGPLKADQDPWQTVAPSAIPFAEGWHAPKAADAQDLDRIEAAFVQAAKRTARLGVEVIELHFAHGYLGHEFQSPFSNQRTDEYGGTPEKRRAFLLRIAEAVRAAVPGTVAVGARITGSDWTEGGITPDDAVALASELKALGLSWVDVTSGGNVSTARIPVGPGYQVPFAAAVKKGSGIVTRAVGMIATAQHAEEILQKGEADQIALARAFLDNPRWGWHAAEALGFDLPRPPQYARAAPKLWPGARLARPDVH
ncbi:oxidoreductase [Alsobacter metallidurans]|uniref:Oxidoreductase n=1 Tax=Alsobacter metallidurans TaxID=340221 RepID=A0A917I3N5_9HYPH|nr:NADH:flavin oxidoreductase/NADH oxidase [Alsobacter metallidurans]GGH06961.1 oxidoreductase [Alsobacter metallidurans]